MDPSYLPEDSILGDSGGPQEFPIKCKSRSSVEVVV
jgi:hypothetical protein